MTENHKPPILSGSLRDLGDRFSTALGIEPGIRGKIYRYIFESADAGQAFYWISLLSACGIATLGLAQNSAAVVIGAMLLSPLMGPIVGVGYALGIGDVYLGFKSAIAAVLSIVVALAASMGLTFLLPFKDATAEILARTRPNPLDLLIALLVGVIAAVSAARSQTQDVGTVLPGAAIAVSLVPPLCVAGWGLGAGPNWMVFRGGMLLFVTNFAAIIFTSMVFFLLIRAGAPEDLDEEKAFVARHDAQRPYFAWFVRQRWASGLRAVGGIYNRLFITLLAVLVLVIPLNSGLTQVKWELLVSSTVRQGLRRYIGDRTILSQRLNVARASVGLSLVLVEGDSPVQPKIHELEAYLNGRLAKPVSVSYTEVAKGELAAAVAGPAPGSLAAASFASVLERLRQEDFSPLRALWPNSSGFQLADVTLQVPTGTGDLSLLITYLSDDDLPPSTLDIYGKAAARSLEVPALRVAARRVPRTWGKAELCSRPGAHAEERLAAEVEATQVPLPQGAKLEAVLVCPPAMGGEELRRAEERASLLVAGTARRLSGHHLPEGFVTERLDTVKCPELLVRATLP